MDNLTGKAFTRSQLAPKCSVEPGRKVRNRPIFHQTRAERRGISDTTFGAGGAQCQRQRNPVGDQHAGHIVRFRHGPGFIQKIPEIDFAAA